MIRMILICAAVLACGSCDGAGDPAPAGARSVALGGLTTALPEDVWSAVNNPALAGTVSGLSVAFSYLPSPFGLSELSRAGVGVNVDLRKFALTASALILQTEAFGEADLTAGLCCPVGPRLSLGASVSARHVRIRSYGSATSFALGAGALLEPVREIRFGVVISNAAGTPLGHSGERPAPTIQMGVTAEPLPVLRCGLDLWKTARFPAELHAGIEYLPLSALSLRAGISQEPSGLSFGAGVHIGPCVLEYAASFHPLLGPSHVLGVNLCMAAW